MNDKTEGADKKNVQLSADMKLYRDGLVETQRKLNESYDKLIITLSGGSLALSITFLKDIIGSNKINDPIFLLLAWGLFVLSLTAILGEILFGIKAHKKAITQVDDGSIHKQKVGGKSSYFSSFAHWLASISLILGLLFISVFAYFNIGDNNGREEASTKTESPTETTANPATAPTEP